ncbi:hypothetical protein ACLB2K_013103 [Fragaria x ananassa]
MLAFEEVFTKVCKDLGEDKEILRNGLMKTPFWDFISIYDKHLVSKSTAKKSDREIQRLIDCYVPKLKKFKFGNKVVEISVYDVEQIFGLQNPKNGINVPTPLEDSKKPVDNSMVQAFFGNEIRITKSRILDLLDAEVKFKRYGWPMRVTQLLLLHLFTTLLFASSGSTLGWSFVKCITDYDTMKKYNWAKGVRDYLLSCLTTSEDGRPHTNSGCVVLIPIDNAEDETNAKDNEQQGDDDFMNHPPKHVVVKPKGKKRQRAKEKKNIIKPSCCGGARSGKKTKRAKKQKHVAGKGIVKQTLRDTVDNAVGDDDFENPPPKNGATMHDAVGKKKATRKNLKKGATAQVEEGSSVVAEKGGSAESEEGALVVTKKGAPAQAKEGASVVAEKDAPAESEEGAHVVSEKRANVQTEEDATAQGATAQAEKGTPVVAEKGATTQAVEGSSGHSELEGNEKATAVDDEGETYEEAATNTKEILKKFFNKDKDADQGGGHEEFASEKMYDPEDFRLYEEFVENESKEFPKATSDEELEYWQEGLGAEKVATAEAEEGSAENVAIAGEEEGSAGNIDNAGEKKGSVVGGAAEREGPRTRSVVRRIKARTDRKEKKSEDFEVQIPLKRQRKKSD